jgi:oxygen-independent coproporphyrinogen-3 oxidase
VQSLDDDRLALLGRRHDSDQALRALDLALASKARVSADFIFATPGSHSEIIAGEVEILAASGIEHVSAYELTLAQGTPLFSRVQSRQLRAVRENECIEQWIAVDEALSQVGMTCYEISNFAKTNRQCLHNASYWRGGLYAGLGAGAHGHMRWNGAHVRYSNGKDVLGYLRPTSLSVDAPVADGSMEVLRPSQRAVELIMLGLRTAEGVHWPSVRRCLKTQKDVEMFDQEANRVVKSGYASWKDDHLAPNRAGMFLADEIASWF